MDCYGKYRRAKENAKAKVRIGRQTTKIFPITNDLKQGDQTENIQTIPQQNILERQDMFRESKANVLIIGYELFP